MMSSVSKYRNSTHQAVKLTWIFIHTINLFLLSNTYLQINYVNKNIYKIHFKNARALKLLLLFYEELIIRYNQRHK